MNFKLTHFVYKGKEQKVLNSLKIWIEWPSLYHRWMRFISSARCLNTRFKSIKNNFFRENDNCEVGANKWSILYSINCTKCRLSFYFNPWHPIWIILHRVLDHSLLWSHVMRTLERRSSKILNWISSNWHTPSVEYFWQTNQSSL